MFRSFLLSLTTKRPVPTKFTEKPNKFYKSKILGKQKEKNCYKNSISLMKELSLQPF
jgi:hypothetical protein